MRSFLPILTLTAAVLLSLAASTPTFAQPSCDLYPSSDCPSRQVVRGHPAYPCSPGQVKADWNTMLYRMPQQTTYASSGYEVNADIWCFDDVDQAVSYGFRRAAN